MQGDPAALTIRACQPSSAMSVTSFNMSGAYSSVIYSMPDQEAGRVPVSLLWPKPLHGIGARVRVVGRSQCTRSNFCAASLQ